MFLLYTNVNPVFGWSKSLSISLYISIYIKINDNLYIVFYWSIIYQGQNVSLKDPTWSPLKRARRPCGASLLVQWAMGLEAQCHRGLRSRWRLFGGEKMGKPWENHRKMVV